MTSTPARDYLLPRLNEMLADAQSDGIARDVAVAVLIDLVTGPGFNDTPLDPAEDTAPMRPGPDALTLQEEEAERSDEMPVGLGVADPSERGKGYRRDLHYGHLMGKPPR